MTERNAEGADLEGIAIVGMSARFAGADNLAEFWNILCRGVEATTFFNIEELLAAGCDPADVHQPHYVRANAVLKDIECFAASFFDIPPGEAELMDPSQRVFLECCWQALEEAAYDPKNYPGWIGVFAGCSTSGYWDQHLRPYCENQPSLRFAARMASRREYLATRVSYKLNLKGPSINVLTACSTSLVAVHQACQSLLNHQCHMALAGGVTIDVPQKTGYFYLEGGIASPDGHCRPFDAQARGTVFGSGAGVAVLKRLSDALADGDHIYAVIKGSAVNNDGAVKVGFSAPGLEGQKKVIAMAQAAANVNPATISYVETHGTGTALGDPVEIEALTQAFRARTDKKQFCAIGSVKANIGHTDTAAGVANLIKTALALKHKVLPPSINYSTPNPKIDFSGSPFFVNDALRDWTANGPLRRAGVSAFGVGGTNAHAILEEAPGRAPSGPSRRCQLLVLSARTDTALERMTDHLAAHLEADPNLNPADVAYTLHLGRHAFECRRMLVCDTPADAAQALRERDPKRVLTGTPVKTDCPVVFMFSGQGSQYVNMGRDLYRNEPLFRKHLDDCAEGFKPLLKLDLREVIYPAPGNPAEAATQLEQTRLAQPALFAIEYALARLLMAWGVRPRAMIGHSIGEYTAACLAGVFHLNDALRLVATRGRLMQGMPPGAMLSVALSETELQARLPAGLAPAAVNGPAQCVVSGPLEAIADLERRLNAENIVSRRLHTAHAFHSAMMDPILKPFENEVRRTRLQPPQIPCLSNVTGTWIRPEDAMDPAYWAAHLRQTVRFSEGIGALSRSADQVFLEVGPGRTLATLTQRHPDLAPNQAVLSCLRHPQDEQKDDGFLLQAIGRMWLAGLTVDWPAFYREERRLRLSLPTYPFERERYWIERSEKKSDAARGAALSKNPNLSDWFYIPVWKSTLPPVADAREKKACWLVFGDETGFCSKFKQLLKAGGNQVSSVIAGPRFAVLGDAYTMNPARPEDYMALWTALVEARQEPTQIVHLWNVAADENRFDLTRSYYSLLFLAQALDSRRSNHKIRLTVISSNLQQVGEQEIVHPEKAALLGPCKVIPQEMPQVFARSVDIVLPPAGSAQEISLAEQLISELKASTTDTLIAYRGKDRLVQTYEPVALAEPREATLPRLRSRGVYLITGGLGGIGLTLAGYLAKTVQARLVLTTRSRFPESQAREAWLTTHDPQDRISLAIRAVQDLEAAGAEVLVLRADVTDLEQMQAVLRTAGERFDTIHGVVHAAGLPGGGIMPLKTKEAAQAVLAPKVQGTRVLESVLSGRPLDWFILCSSLAAIVGGAGQSDYCAANAFMDAYARSCSGRGRRKIISVNWDAWGQVGMAFNTQADHGARPARRPGPSKPVDHPLLRESFEEAPGRTVYCLELSPAKDWVLSDHVLWGIPTLPGTTHLELARAAFADRGGSHDFEIQEALFLAPLMVSPGDSKEARLILEEGAGDFGFQVQSKAGISAGGEAIWQTHVLGKIGPGRQARPQPYDLAALRERCPVPEEVMTPALRAQKDTPLQFGPRWRALRLVQNGPRETLGLLELDPELRSDVDQFKLHPALLDLAVSFAPTAHAELDLPLSYRRMRVYERLPSRFFSYIRRKPDQPADRETVTVRVTLLDEAGRVLADIEEFTMMRVKETAAARLRGSAPGPALLGEEEQQKAQPPFNQDPRNAILPAEGIRAFQYVLFSHDLPQIAVCPRHLPTVIRRAGEGFAAEKEQRAAAHRADRSKYARPKLATAYQAPRNETESRLADIWKEALGIEKVGVLDKFYELGGDSLLAIVLIMRIRETFKVDLALSVLFEQPTVAEMSLLIAERQSRSGSGGEPAAALPALTPAPADQYEPFDLTDVQQAYWIGRSGAFELGNVSTHAYAEHEVRGLDLERFEAAWQKLIERHGMLRAVILPDGRQRILETVPLYRIPTVDLRRAAPDAVSAELAKIRGEMSHQVLPADRWPLFEIRAVLLPDDVIRLHMSTDMLIEDVWSIQIIWRELGRFYRDPQAELPPLQLSFRDYVLAEGKLRQSPIYEESLRYWRERLKTLAPAPELPLVKTPASPAQPRFIRHNREMDADRWQRLKEQAAQRGLTPSLVLLTAFSAVLAAWSKHPRFTINLTLFNRLPLHPQVNDLVGDFTSLTLLETDLSEEIPFEEQARRIQKQLWRDLDHRYVGGIRVIRELMQRQGGMPHTLMPVVFTSTLVLGRVGETAREQETEANIRRSFETVYSISQTPQVWLDHQIYERNGALLTNWDAVEGLFPPQMLDDMFAAYHRLLERLADDERAWSGSTRELAPVPDNQLRERALVNATRGPRSRELLHTLFASQARQRPEQAALITSRRSLTYAELYQAANRIGHWLRERDVKPGTLTAIVMDKGWEQAAAAMGILNAGGAYLPIDPHLPKERLQYLLKQGEVQWALTQPWLAEKIEWPEGIGHASITPEGFREWSAEPPTALQTATDLAYVIFTSGSTGEPKGVMIDHQGAVNTILDINERFQVRPADRILGLSALNFDLAVYDLFGMLAAGATLVLPDADKGRDPGHWREMMEKHRVTLWNTVPALMEMLVEYIKGEKGSLPANLRLVFMSGDWIPLPLPERIRKAGKPGIEIYSGGGATEASIWSILYRIGEGESSRSSIPYGKPLRNQSFHVLDDHLNPRPVWVPGQLYIGGTGLAQGYWRDEEQTKNSFLIHPKTGERLYRTGDLGRYLPDGNLEFLGREDNQVKVQGYRIELGEIESVLSRHPRVKAAAITAVGDPRGEKRLVGYIVPAREQAASQAPPQDYRPQKGEGLILDPVERFKFKMSRPGLRKINGNRPQARLGKPVPDEKLMARYTSRRSHRKFASEVLAIEALSRLLSCLSQVRLEGVPLPKYRYGSAGSLYPVQTHLYIKPERVRDLKSGTYYYDPEEHRLVLLSAEAVLDHDLYESGNREIFDSAAFCIFLTAGPEAILPMYGEWSRDFCMLEAGLMTQLLELSAPEQDLGLCQIGGFDFEPIRAYFELEPDHLYLHSLLGGGLPENGMGVAAPAEERADLRIMKEALETGLRPGVEAAAEETGAEATGLAKALKEFLRERLPEYMVPGQWVKLAALPLTPNGKVDRKALPMPETEPAAPEQGDAAPETDVERKIAEIWREVLKQERIGRHDNFFDLGGNSLSLIQAYRKLKEQLNLDLSIVKMFENPTIGSLIRYIGQGEESLPALEQSQSRILARRTSQKRAKRNEDLSIFSKKKPF